MSNSKDAVRKILGLVKADNSTPSSTAPEGVICDGIPA